jgi:hypothetical protein
MVGITERKIPLGRLMHKWKDTIEVDLKEVGYQDLN